MIDGGKLGGKHKYSTEEQVVGEWIDGKKVYEKVYFFTNPMTIKGSTWTKIADEINGIDIIIHSSIFGTVSSTDDRLTNSNNYELMHTVGTGLSINFSFANTISRYVKCFTIRYTKTTD